MTPEQNLNGVQFGANQDSNNENNARFANAPREVRRNTSTNALNSISNQTNSNSNQLPFNNEHACSFQYQQASTHSNIHTTLTTQMQDNCINLNPNQQQFALSNRENQICSDTQTNPQQIQYAQDPQLYQPHLPAESLQHLKTEQRTSQGQKPIRREEQMLNAGPSKRITRLNQNFQQTEEPFIMPPMHFSQRESMQAFEQAQRSSDASNLQKGPLVMQESRPHGHSQGATVGHRSKQESMLIGALDNGDNTHELNLVNPLEEHKQEESVGTVTYINSNPKSEFPKPVNNRKSAPHGGNQQQRQTQGVFGATAQVNYHQQQQNRESVIPFDQESQSILSDDTENKVQRFSSPSYSQKSSIIDNKGAKNKSRKQKHTTKNLNNNLISDSENLTQKSLQDPQALAQSIKHLQQREQLNITRAPSQIMTRSKAKQLEQLQNQQREQPTSINDFNSQIEAPQVIQSRMQAPQHRPTSSATFHPAAKPGQTESEVIDDEPAPEEEDELPQTAVPSQRNQQFNLNTDMAEGDLGSGSTDDNKVDHQLPPQSQVQHAHHQSMASENNSEFHTQQDAQAYVQLKHQQTFQQANEEYKQEVPCVDDTIMQEDDEEMVASQIQQQENRHQIQPNMEAGLILREHHNQVNQAQIFTGHCGQQSAAHAPQTSRLSEQVVIESVDEARWRMYNSGQGLNNAQVAPQNQHRTYAGQQQLADETRQYARPQSSRVSQQQQMPQQVARVPYQQQQHPGPGQNGHQGNCLNQTTHAFQNMNIAGFGRSPPEQIHRAQACPQQQQPASSVRTVVPQVPRRMPFRRYVVPQGVQNLTPQQKEEDIMRASHFQWMLQAERNNPVSINESQRNNINVQLRANYIDRLIQMQVYYSNVMKEETLFLTVYLIDKYLEKRGEMITDENTLDLLSVTALYTAGKYEDIWPPKLDTILASLPPAQFSKQTVKLWEIELLTAIDFELNVPTPFRFLEFFLWSLNLDTCMDTRDFCRFLLDMMLLETYFQQYSPSVLAAGALYCAGNQMRQINAEGPGPNMEALDLLIKEQRLDKEYIQICAHSLKHDIPRCFNSRFTAYRVKYAGKWFMQQQVNANMDPNFHYHHRPQ